MTKQLLGAFLSLVVSGALGGCLSGCSNPAMPREFEAVFKSVATSITDQASWSNVVGQVDGQVIEPGVLVEGGVKYFAAAKMTGVSGQVGLSASGSGTGRASPEALAAIRALLAKEGVAEETIRRITDAVLQQPRGDLEVTTLPAGETVHAEQAQPAAVKGTVAYGNVPSGQAAPSISDVAGLRAELLSYGLKPGLVDQVVAALEPQTVVPK